MQTYYIVDASVYTSNVKRVYSYQGVVNYSKDKVFKFYTGNVSHIFLLKFSEKEDKLEIILTRASSIRFSISKKIKEYLQEHCLDGICFVLFDRVKNDLIADLTNKKVFSDLFSSIAIEQPIGEHYICLGKDGIFELMNDKDNLGLVFSAATVAKQLVKSNSGVNIPKNERDFISLVANYFNLRDEIASYLLNQSGFSELFVPEGNDLEDWSSIKLDALSDLILGNTTCLKLSDILKNNFIEYSKDRITVIDDTSIPFEHTINDIYAKMGALYISFDTKFEGSYLNYLEKINELLGLDNNREKRFEVHLLFNPEFQKI
jgi:hypothetical protein